MFKDLLEKLDSDQLLDALCELDARGIFPGDGESVEDFKSRVGKLTEVLNEFYKTLESEGKIEVLDDVYASSGDLIGAEIVDEASCLTRRLYNFAANWNPGFFLSKSLGWLWGGCMVHDSETSLSVFLIRNAFKKSKRFIFYSRQELLAHEICHVARAPLGDNEFEEYFAYQTSPSRLRRYLGNCFRAKSDALFFLGPLFLLLTAQFTALFLFENLMIWPFWIFALGSPLLLLLRNQKSRNILARALKNLKNAEVFEAQSVLFRCTAEEIRAIAILDNAQALHSFLEHKFSTSPRWQIIEKRFCPAPVTAP